MIVLMLYFCAVTNDHGHHSQSGDCWSEDRAFPLYTEDGCQQAAFYEQEHDPELATAMCMPLYLYLEECAKWKGARRLPWPGSRLDHILARRQRGAT